MLRFEILSGRQTGSAPTARRFPVVLGRHPRAQVRLDDPGVWDEHAIVQVDASGFRLRSHSAAVTRVNGLPVQETRLRDGDLIELGAARLRVGWVDTRPKSFRFREQSTWLALAALIGIQFVLIYAVLP